MAKSQVEKRHERMRKIVAAFQHYVATYTNQQSYEDYSDKTFIEDMLYGIGTALDGKKFFAATGYGLFKEQILSMYVNDSALQRPVE